ncbi:MAG: hypothetical protein JWO96_152, partial [Candidatus Saccharibacteria bacterium]|nr:hypothetical protein [Candidatus Saccharibacteria bacterium]
TGSVPASFASGAGNLDLANEKFSIMASPSGALAAFAAQGTATPAADTMVIYKGAVCSANVPTATNATPRSIVIFFAVESSNGNVPQCTQV